MPSVSMTVNGKAVTADVDSRTLLVQFLREHLRLELREIPLHRKIGFRKVEGRAVIFCRGVTHGCARTPSRGDCE